MTTRSDARRGIVLVTVLWMVALLAALAMAAAITFRGFTGIAALDRDRVQAEALLMGGLEAAVGSVARADGASVADIGITTVLSTGSVRAHLTDESGRIDIGKAPAEILAGAFRVVGASAEEAEAMARAIVEWRSPPGVTPPNAQETSPNPAAARRAADMAFTDVRQLARVPGVTPEWAARVAPLTTVYGSDKVNALTAPAEVLAAVPGVDMDRAAAFVRSRGQFAVEAVRAAAMLGTTEDYIDVKNGSVLSVDLRATLVNGLQQAARSVIFVTPQGVAPYRILVWNDLPSLPPE
jgi:general secretion pathway protein K